VAAPVPFRITDMRVLGTLAPQSGHTEGPTTPLNVAAVAINAGRIDVTWTASTDPFGIGGYQVFRDGQPLNTAAGTTYSDLTCQPSTTYSYVIVAFDTVGNNSSPSTASGATTPANAAPVWQSISAQTLIVGNAYLLDLAGFGTDADADTLTFSVATGTLPSGISLSGTRLQGTCTTAGQSPSVTLRAADQFHQSDIVVAFATYTADVTAPPVPTGVTASTVNSSQIDVAWSASIDVAGSANELVSGTQDYRVYRSTDGTNYALRATVTGLTYSDTGLSASTPYWYAVAARDITLNESLKSTASNTTTLAASSWFPNWPIMATAYIIGDVTKNYVDTTVRVWCGEKDLIVTAWFYPTGARVSTRTPGLQFLRDNYPGCKHILYMEDNETLKTVTSPSSDSKELTKALVDSAVTGNPGWYLRRASNGTQMESLFSTSMWELNCASLDAGVNSLGQRYDQAWTQLMWNSFNTGVCANLFTNFYDGIFCDNFHARYPGGHTQNNGANTVPFTDIDYNNNGVADVVNKYDGTSTAGGTFLTRGRLQFKATAEAQFGALIPNAARWPYDYYDNASFKPPLPLSGHPYYGQWSVVLSESVNNNFGILRNSSTATGFEYVGVDPFGAALPRLALHEKMLGSDSASFAGRSVILLEAYTPSRTGNAFTQADYAYSRFFLCVALLFEKYAHCISSIKNVPIPLDELILEIGTPIGTRSMGTLNETTLAWSTRVADFSSGVARFYWQRFTKGIAVVRLDVPTVGVWPSADAPVACTLPAPGAGKKWQMINAATYVSPAIWSGPGGVKVTRTMRGQDTTLNNGADVTTVSLRPLHGAIVRLV
jgi:hypothetical protein